MKLISKPLSESDRSLASLWIVLVGVVFIVSIAAASAVGAIGSGVLLVLGIAYLHNSVWNVVDEVFEHGERLIVHHGDLIQYVPFEAIEDIYRTFPNRWDLVTIKCTSDGPIGNSITFKAASVWRLFRDPPILRHLKARIEGTNHTG